MAQLILISQKDFDELFEITLLKMADVIKNNFTSPILNSEERRFRFYLDDLKRKIENKEV